MQLSGYFTPADSFYRWDHSCNNGNGNDVDLGSAGEMLVPDGVLPDPYKHIVIKGDKEGYIWVIDRTHPGATGTGCGQSCQPCTTYTNNVLQQVSIAGTQARSTPAFWYDGTTPFMYVAQQNTDLFQYKLNCGYPNGPICSPAVSNTSVDPAGTKIGYATTPSVSSNGTTQNTGIVWAVKGPARANVGLYAFDAENLNSVLYQPSDCPRRDAIGPAKFSVPTIANGYVFVGTQTDFDIFGATPPAC